MWDRISSYLLKIPNDLYLTIFFSTTVPAFQESKNWASLEAIIDFFFSKFPPIYIEFFP